MSRTNLQQILPASTDCARISGIDLPEFAEPTLICLQSICNGVQLASKTARFGSGFGGQRTVRAIETSRLSVRLSAHNPKVVVGSQLCTFCACSQKNLRAMHQGRNGEVADTNVHGDIPGFGSPLEICFPSRPWTSVATLHVNLGTWPARERSRAPRAVGFDDVARPHGNSKTARRVELLSACLAVSDS